MLPPEVNMRRLGQLSLALLPLVLAAALLFALHSEAVAGWVDALASRFLAVLVLLTLLVCSALTLGRPTPQRARRVFLWAGAVFAVVFAADAIVYAINREPRLPWVVPDDQLMFTMRPYWRVEKWFLGDLTTWDPTERRYVRLLYDRDGFLNGESLEQADVVFIGDSLLTWGPTYADTIPALFAGLTGASIANLGRICYTAQQELLILEQRGLSLKPKVVVWEIFEGNDLDEAQAFAQWRAGQIAPWLLKAPSVREQVYDWSQHSAVLRITRAALLPTGLNRFDYAVPGDARNVEAHPGWPPLVAALGEGAQVARAAGVELIIVFVPCKGSVFGEAATRPGMAVLLEQWSQQHAARFVDAWPELRRRSLQPKEPRVYWRNDSHLTPAGSTVVAELLQAAVASWASGPAGRGVHQVGP